MRNGSEYVFLANFRYFIGVQKGQFPFPLLYFFTVPLLWADRKIGFENSLLKWSTLGG